MRSRPSASDYRALVRLTGEAGNFAEPSERALHLVDGFRRLVGAVGIGWGRPVFGDDGRPTRMDPRYGRVVGLNHGDLLPIYEHDFYSDTLVHPMRRWYDAPRRLGRPRQRTLLAQEMLGDRGWHESAFYRDIFRPSGVDLMVMSRRDDGEGRSVGLAIIREPGDRPAGGRESTLLKLFHRELFPLLSRPFDADVPARPALPPRFVPVFDALLAGEQSKHPARRLGLSLATVYEYTKQIYRRLGVGSRGELLARYVRR